MLAVCSQLLPMENANPQLEGKASCKTQPLFSRCKAGQYAGTIGTALYESQRRNEHTYPKIIRSRLVVPHIESEADGAKKQQILSNSCARTVISTTFSSALRSVSPYQDMNGPPDPRCHASVRN